jgi:DNA invertase Pin-like site-specific DNA recombinase
MIIGFARTSTLDEEAGLDAQVHDLESLGCVRIFQKAEQCDGFGEGSSALEHGRTLARCRQASTREESACPAASHPRHASSVVSGRRGWEP